MRAVLVQRVSSGGGLDGSSRKTHFAVSLLDLVVLAALLELEDAVVVRHLARAHALDECRLPPSRSISCRPSPAPCPQRTCAGVNGLSSGGAGSALAALGVALLADEADEPEAVALPPLFCSRSSFCSRFVAAVEGDRATLLRQKRSAESRSPAACLRRAISSERVLWALRLSGHYSGQANETHASSAFIERAAS